MAIPPAEKAALRKDLLARRAALGPEQQEARSARIHERLWALPQMAGARGVHCYLSFGDEVRTAPIFARCRDLGIATYAPFQIPQAGRLGSAPWRPGDAIARGRMGVPEPALKPHPGAEPEPADMRWDVILAPGLAFDRTGSRIGFGKGYYDRFLRACAGARDQAGTPPRQRACTVIGLAYALQVLERLPADSWDEPMDIVVTENETIYCR